MGPHQPSSKTAALKAGQGSREEGPEFPSSLNALGSFWPYLSAHAGPQSSPALGSHLSWPMRALNTQRTKAQREISPLGLPRSPASGRAPLPGGTLRRARGVMNTGCYRKRMNRRPLPLKLIIRCRLMNGFYIFIKNVKKKKNTTSLASCIKNLEVLFHKIWHLGMAWSPSSEQVIFLVLGAQLFPHVRTGMCVMLGRQSSLLSAPGEKGTVVGLYRVSWMWDPKKPWGGPCLQSHKGGWHLGSSGSENEVPEFASPAPPKAGGPARLHGPRGSRGADSRTAGPWGVSRPSLMLGQQMLQCRA